MEKRRKAMSKLTFEEALSELEDISKRLEEGSLGLDNSIVEFERGTELVRFCQDKLEEAERKIEILQRGEERGEKKIKRKRIKVKADTGEIDDQEDLQGSLL